MSNNLRVGQKVVCVNVTRRYPNGRLGPLRYGRVYTVRQTGLEHWLAPGEPCVRLEEIYRERCELTDEEDSPYLASRFRPAVDKPCSIEIFRKMLTPTKELV